MDQIELKQRTKTFALRIMKLVEALPKKPAGWAIGKQLIRSGTSVGANYRAACRARSRAEFIAKIGLVEEEADERPSGSKSVRNRVGVSKGCRSPHQRGERPDGDLCPLRDDCPSIINVISNHQPTTSNSPASNQQLT